MTHRLCKYACAQTMRHASLRKPHPG
uniref:Uncharacterized protein n=1 Tax=Anguilla anguilla TaxID=7936 RepID=A0A0E9V6L3_ANGAN